MKQINLKGKNLFFKYIAYKNKSKLTPHKQNISNLHTTNSYFNIQQKNNIKITNILNYLEYSKYDKAIKEIKSFIQNNINITNDIITSFLTGIIIIKNNNIDKYILILLKLLSFQNSNSKLNFDNSIINLLYRILIHLFKDTLLKNILSNDYQSNKLTITNFHCLLLIYITYGYIFCKNNENEKEKELKDILKKLIIQSQSREKKHFEKCHICLEIDKIIQNNINLISPNQNFNSYKKAIRINNNCLSAQKLMQECHLITKVKGQNEGLSLQHYILNANKQQKNNSISINKKNNFNDTYDMLKTSFSSISESLIKKKILKTTGNNIKYKLYNQNYNESISNKSNSITSERINYNIINLRNGNSRNNKANISSIKPKINQYNKINNYINDIQNNIQHLENNFDNFKTFTENTKKQMKLYSYIEYPIKVKK
jgi:hypothetical protein